MTFQDQSVTDPQESLEKFGQEDQVQVDGPDYNDRLRTAGFQVEIYRRCGLYSHEENLRQGFGAAAGKICYCRRA